MTPFLVIICTEPDPDREIRRGGGGGGLGHPDPEIRREGGSPKRFLRPFGPQFGLKIRGAPSPGSTTVVASSFILFSYLLLDFWYT